MAPWYHGTMAPWHHGTMAPWYHGTRGSSFLGPGHHTTISVIGLVEEGYHTTLCPSLFFGSRVAGNLIPKRIKNTKNTGTPKKCIKTRLGEPTFRPEGGFGSIFGSLEEPKNRHFERKLKVRKKVKKKVVKLIASAGDAEGGKEGLDGWTGKDSARPWPIRGDGRAD